MAGKKLDDDGARPRFYGQPRADALYEIYHLNAAIERCDTGFLRRVFEINASDIGHQMAARAAKRYACAARTSLPDVKEDPSMSITEAIRRRRSSARFFGGPITLSTLSTILKYANGLTGVARADGLPRRAIPSGGALYPTELYVLPLNVSGLPVGAYHYDVLKHELARYHDRSAEGLLASACFNEMAVMSAAVALVITASFERQRTKYGERAYRFALLEAGHLAQNVLLVAAGFDLAALPIGGFVDREVNNYLEIDGIDEAALYVLLIGRPLDLGDSRISERKGA